MKALPWLALIMMTCLIAAPAVGDVDLEWRPESESWEVGQTVRVGLYAVADNDGQDEPFCLMAVICEWNPSKLALLGVDDDGPYVWMLSGFPDDSGGDGLNNTFDDGNAQYHAWPPLDWPLGQGLPIATPEGLLVTTFEFLAAAPGSANLEMLDEYGTFAVTGVYDDQYGGWNIVGQLDNELIMIELPSAPPEHRE